MDGRCRVCGKTVSPMLTVCTNTRCVKRVKPCKLCGIQKVGRSPYCSWCRKDRLNGAKLTLDPEWVARYGGRDRRPVRRPKDGPPEVGLHWCAGCRDWLHPRWFLRWNDYKKGKDIPPRCRPCRSQAGHDARIKKLFGIAPDEYQRILEVQGGVCAICGQRPVNTRLSVDHDHSKENGESIRGLLCSRCNHDLLGAAHDSIPILERAIAYLTDPPAVRVPAPVAVGY